MYKRIICLTLTAMLLVSAVNVSVYAVETQPTTETTQQTAPQESASGPLTTSAEAIAMLKKEEGFSSKPYWDYAQWTVGYGTKCPDDMLEYYKQYGISEAEAESLLRTYLVKFENELHKFMNKTGLKLTQKSV